ncbi:phage tail sheath monomer [Lachnospiraceae bacterium KM106-2]|nr:phage tail sheath monomer [Lachnospiraceae bacterium KM106-2]
MAYNHGIRVKENATSLSKPVTGMAALQVVFGTAPVNLAADPYGVTNVLVKVETFEDAYKKLGYSDDFSKYTLCQSMDACFRVLNVAPVIFCNVLDPKKHVKDNEESEVTVASKQAVIKVDGILLDTIVVKSGESTLQANTDYVTSFDDNGYAVITLVTGGAGDAATTLKVTSKSIDPSKVTESDIIGGYDTVTGKETGCELVRHVYPMFNMTPGLLLAPGWTQNQNVAAALELKTDNINGYFKASCIVDLDTHTATKYTDCEAQKKSKALTSPNTIVVWPMAKVGDKKYYYSALYAALIAYVDASNDDVPNLSPSNKLIGVTAAVLEDGTEVTLDTQQANVLNSVGIVTLLNDAGWRTWGNNTACYPENTDPKDRWICCRRFFSWWGNSFILTYKEKVDDPANFRLIESVVDAENIRGNSYVQQGKMAGAKIEYSEQDNPIEDVLNGKIQFYQHIAPYTPAEDIINVLEFDPTMIKNALSGGAE